MRIQVFLTILAVWGPIFGAQAAFAEKEAGSVPLPAVEEFVPEHSPLSNPHFDILVVSILETRPAPGETPPATNDNPPTGRLVIREVLRGRKQAGAEHAFDLIAPLRREDRISLPGGKFEAKPEWHTMPLPGPKPGDQLIVFATHSPKGSDALGLQWPLIRLTEANRLVVASKMAKQDRAAEIQLPLFILMLVSPVVGGYLLFRGRPRRSVVALCGIALVAYPYYESGISKQTDIRVDLIFVYPALVIAAFVLGIVGAQAWLEARRRAKRTHP